MSKVLMDNLDRALEDIQMPHVYCDSIDQIVSKITDLEDQVKDAKKELSTVVDKLCADLATEVRQLQPGLSVLLKTNRCEIGYRSKCLSCQVRPFEGCWDFTAYEFGRHFAKRYPHCCKLNCPLSDIAAAVVEYFNSNFRSLI